MPKIFVLIESQSGIVPQMWHIEQVSGEGEERLQPVFKYQLTSEEENAWNAEARYREFYGL
jgi:hypothetical protein